MKANPFENVAMIGLDYILPNPYQTREREDPLHVAKVAESILTQGLLQPPVGRYVSLKKCELAFGHTRLAAYKLLTRLGLQGDSDGLDLTEFPALARLLAQRVAGELSDEAGKAWLYLPVNMRELSDEEMFRLAVSENLARKDLTPIEEAKAMARYRDDFGKTSEQIGELFGVTGSAVRHKIALLGLPDGLKEAFAAGTLSEGAAREVLSLLALPERMRADAERQWNHEINPKQIIKDAVSGALASNIHERVEQIVAQFAEDLSKAPWTHDETIRMDESGAPKDLPACAGCPQRLQRGKKMICLDRICYWEKNKAWQWRYARRAAEAAGYPVLDVKWDGNQSGEYHTTFYGYGGTLHQALQAAIGARCPNLRVAFGEANAESGGLKEMGYPKAKLVCAKREGYCTCHQAVKAGVSLNRAAPEAEGAPENDSVTMVTVEETPAANSPSGARSAITVEELSEVAREARRQKKANMAECRDLLDQAAWIIGEGLYDGNPGALKLVLDHSTYKFRDQELKAEEIRFELGRLVAAGIHNPEGYDSPDPERSLEHYNQALQKAGLKIMTRATEEPGDGDD